MKLKIALAAVCLALMASLPAAAKKASPKQTSSYAHLYEGLPFDMPVIDKPAFQDLTVQLTDFGAVADGKTLNTEAFAKAMAHLNAKGGGTLNVPSGVWLTGPITFKSNVNLHLEGGAIILFSPNPDDYPLVYTWYEGYQHYRAMSPLNADGAENIAITGEGVIDGNGNAWRMVRRNQMNEAQWKRKVASGGILVDGTNWYPGEDYILGETYKRQLKDIDKETAAKIKRFLRPVLLKFINCKNVYLQGVLFQNTPAWNLHPIMCENLIIDNVYLKNPVFAHNGDGLDVESCKNVIIYRTTLDVGDDAICIKSGKDKEGRDRGIPTENVIVKDCRVFEGHGGFVVGSEMSGGVKNISVRDCQFIGTDVGLRFKSCRGRGGVVENIYIDNINMINISGEAVLFDLYYFVKNGPTGVPPVDETTPQFKDIFINNVEAFNSGMCLKFNGIPEMPIENIRMTNAKLTGRKGGLLSESKDIVFDNVDVTCTEGPALTINNVSNATLTNCRFTTPDPEVIKETGTNTAIRIDR